MTDIPAERTRVLPRLENLPSYSNPSFQIEENTLYLSISVFFSSFQYRHRSIKTNSLSSVDPNYERSPNANRENTFFYFSSRAVHTFASQRYPIAIPNRIRVLLLVTANRIQFGLDKNYFITVKIEPQIFEALFSHVRTIFEISKTVEAGFVIVIESHLKIVASGA